MYEIHTMKTDCIMCRGAGKTPVNLNGDAYDPCPVCDGKGSMTKEEWDQKISKDLQRLHMQGQGLMRTAHSMSVKKDLACDQEPVKVAAIFDGHRWQLFSTRPVEIAIVTCLSGQEKPRPVTVANIQPVVDMATFRETVHDKLAALTQSGQIDLRQLADFTK